MNTATPLIVDLNKTPRTTQYYAIFRHMERGVFAHPEKPSSTRITFLDLEKSEALVRLSDDDILNSLFNDSVRFQNAGIIDSCLESPHQADEILGYTEFRRRTVSFPGTIYKKVPEGSLFVRALAFDGMTGWTDLFLPLREALRGALAETPN